MSPPPIMPKNYSVPSESSVPESPAANDALRRKRLLYAAQHRGVLELDLILGRYAAAEINHLDTRTIDLFEQLLNLDEPNLQALM
ncbi:MAG: succinate dehydrogenase assembly factor 2, partial [Alphaproteobacteria bacterium]|nr:succinate dehydrogenase assembly factor 2 [Alphaproteobacteria bacterium]